MFDVNFEIQIIRLLPPFLRKPKMVAWLNIMLLPLVQLYGTFLAYRSDTLRAVSITPSTYSLEYYLNFLFTGVVPVVADYSLDYSDGGIWIENNNDAETLNFVYDANDNQDTMIVYDAEDGEQTYLYDFEDYLDNDTFVVHVPASFNINEDLLKGILNKYKVAGNQYSINYY